ncbi:ras and ef-hand domain-containing protein [Anaeramoeba flamelloides]|uniref:Ras and ef-hand domain-containing protein n=1 Tax=Anaeramoeba flamelloides TaxID=1746091 RepID=A0AAV7ZY90_9EUKA|nr:ras and ef-hand domain-containing protein [Anaeramoeba flamelloides]
MWRLTLNLLTFLFPLSNNQIAVGKTCLLLRFSEDEFDFNLPPTVGIDLRMRTLRINGERVRIQVWDTAGQERFRKITSSYYRGAQGILLTFSVTDRKSFDNIHSWTEDINKCSDNNISTILVGNKIDLEDRVVSKEEGQEVATQYGMTYIETSAKTGEGVEQAFLTLTKLILEKNQDVKVNEVTENQVIPEITEEDINNNKKKRHSGGCC